MKTNQNSVANPAATQNKVNKSKISLKLWQKIIIGMFLGMCSGLLIEMSVNSGSTFFSDTGITQGLLDASTIYMNLLKMIVVPVVFFAILYGITSIDDMETFGRLGSKAIAIYMTVTVIAIIVGIGFGLIFNPGQGIELTGLSANSGANQNYQTIRGILMGIITTNIVKSMADGQILQVVVFAFFLGTSLVMIGEKAAPAKTVIVSFTQAIFKLVEIVIRTTPYGIFAIMASMIPQYGLDIVATLGKLMLVVIGALIIQYLLFAVMLVLAKINPIPFYKKMVVTQALAFASSSSKATIGTAIEELMYKMGVSQKTATFILPLGASINMTATAIYLGITAIFFAQVYAIDLSISQYILIIFTSTIGSIGAAGFPGGGIIMMGMVLSSAGIPIEGIPLLMGIDRILDMCRTMINITGDCVVTVIVDKIEGSINMKRYLKEM